VLHLVGQLLIQTKDTRDHKHKILLYIIIIIIIIVTQRPRTGIQTRCVLPRLSAHLGTVYDVYTVPLTTSGGRCTVGQRRQYCCLLGLY